MRAERTAYTLVSFTSSEGLIMDFYHATLYVHILALLAGIAAATLAHFAMTRLERSATIQEARQWHALIGRVTKVFPAAILTFFATGAYMVGRKCVSASQLDW